MYYIRGTGGYLTSLEKLVVCGTLTKEGQPHPDGFDPAVSFETKELAQSALDDFNRRIPNHNQFKVVED